MCKKGYKKGKDNLASPFNPFLWYFQCVIVFVIYYVCREKGTKVNMKKLHKNYIVFYYIYQETKSNFSSKT